MLVKKDILNFPIHLGTHQQFVHEILQLAATRNSSYICVAAVHQLIEAHRDSSYSKISRGANLVTPDGMPVTWALRLLYHIKQERVAGMDLLPELLKEAQKTNISVFFYGGTEEMLTKTDQYVKQNFPGLCLAGTYSPPFRNLTPTEELEICDLINKSGAQLVFVVLGCPKQERWMALMKDKINATMVGIGAALPVMVGLQSRAPHWMQHSGLEWSYRLIQEPRRLWKRYFVTNTLFIYLLLFEKLKFKLNSLKHFLYNPKVSLNNVFTICLEELKRIRLL
jgi:N-acetylglucosaminyldiphosphoundecaprenol N-acetyl-beta-D-mannosaminyltransferase